MNRSGQVDKNWVVRQFGQANPEGPGRGDVPALLRRVADTIATLGDVDILDVCFHSRPSHEEDDISITVYYVPREAENV